MSVGLTPRYSADAARTPLQLFRWMACAGGLRGARLPGAHLLSTAACSATVTRPVTPGHSACRRTGNRANAGDVEAEGGRMAVVLKTTVPGRVPGVRIPLPPPMLSM